MIITFFSPPVHHSSFSFVLIQGILFFWWIGFSSCTPHFIFFCLDTKEKIKAVKKKLKSDGGRLKPAKLARRPGI